MDWSKPTTQMLGRFQPWHQGHTELFKRALSKTGQVVILLRESDGTDSNPFTIEQRINFIKDALSAFAGALTAVVAAFLPFLALLTNPFFPFLAASLSAFFLALILFLYL